MRIAIAAAIAAFACIAPAHAQRLDTRRTLVKDDATGTTCSFNAYPQLMLSDRSRDGGAKSATWIQAPLAGDEDDKLRLVFEDSKDWRRPEMFFAMFTLFDASAIAPGAVAGGRVILGSNTIPTELARRDDRLVFMLRRDPVELGGLLVGADKIDLELHDAAGTVVGRYAWDSHRLDEASETLSITGWSCTTS